MESPCVAHNIDHWLCLAIDVVVNRGLNSIDCYDVLISNAQFQCKQRQEKGGWGDGINEPILKGLCNIVQMRDSGAKVLTSMLDVQLKII